MVVDHSALVKWNSCAQHIHIPEERASVIKRLHVYDFDNTLFKSPAPNQNILAGNLIAALANCDRFSNGGWWSEARMLAAAAEEWIGLSQKGKEVDDEFWISEVVQLSWLSTEDSETVSVMMTGRREVFFADVIGQLLENKVFGKKLRFNAILLKKEGFLSTLNYKTTCLTELLNDYPNLEEVTIYDDRAKQLKGFQRFMNDYVAKVNNSLLYNLVHVPGEIRYLDPKREVAIIGEIIEEHNRDVDLRRRGKYKGKVTSAPNFQMEKVSIHEVISFVGYSINIESRRHILEFVTQELTHVFGSSDEELNQYTFSPSFIPATRIHTLPSKTILGQLVSGTTSWDQNDEHNLIAMAEEFNDLKRRVFVKFRLKCFGKYQNRAYFIEVQPIPDDRFVKTDAVDMLVFYLGQRADSHIPPKLTYEYAISQETEWEDIEQDIFINTELQYLYMYNLSGFNKTNKKRKMQK